MLFETMFVLYTFTIIISVLALIFCIIAMLTDFNMFQFYGLIFILIVGCGSLYEAHDITVNHKSCYKVINKPILRLENDQIVENNIHSICYFSDNVTKLEYKTDE